MSGPVRVNPAAARSDRERRLREAETAIRASEERELERRQRPTISESVAEMLEAAEEGRLEILEALAGD